MKQYIKLMRIHHYLKNILVFMPLICSGQLFLELNKIVNGIVGFICFCAISSSIYIINDIFDREKDRLHPKKKLRPIAAGAISLKQAIILSAGLLVIAVLCSLFLFDNLALILILVYWVMNIAYSYGAKNVPIIDIIILASGFLIRILYGAVITDIIVSNWLYLTVILFSLYFSLGKRRNELRQCSEGDTRKVLRQYSIAFLDKNMYMCLALANTFYALWTMDSETIARYSNRNLVFSIPIVIVITMKYSLDVEGESDGDPIEVLLHDKMLIIMCAIYIVMMFLILYFAR